MAKPSIASIREVLKDQDWLWSPYFRIIPLKSAEIERVLSQYYSAMDIWIKDIEKTAEKIPHVGVSIPQNYWENGRPKEQGHSNTKEVCDYWRQKARDAVMTHTHGGMQKPFAVRHRRLLQNLGIIGSLRKSTSVYYFAIAWQFDEWYSHLLKVYYDTQHCRLGNQWQKTSEQCEGAAATNEPKDSLLEAVLGYLLVKRIDLLKEELDSVLDEEDQK